MKQITKQYLEKNIGNYAYITTKDLIPFQGYYEGVIKQFSNNKIILDNDIAINYFDIRSMVIEEIN